MTQSYRNSTNRDPSAARQPSVVRPGGASWIPSASQRASSVSRAPNANDAVIAAASATLKASDAAKAGLKTGIASGLRFMQFLRAYIQAFAAGFGSYLLLTELASGHYNILAMIAMHLVSIIAAPFYALMLAPMIFAVYRGAGAVGTPPHLRAYAVGCSLGVLMLAQRIISGKFVLEGNAHADLFAIATIAAGAIAALTFNRAVDRIEAKAA